MNFLNKVLISIIVFLIIMISGTVIFYNTTNKTIQHNNTPPASPEKSIESGFFSLPQYRTTTSDEIPIPVIITAYLKFQKDDREFYEEIDRKNQKIKSIFLEYFSSQTKQALVTKGELKTKTELVMAINEELVLGSIIDVYFIDYIFLD